MSYFISQYNLEVEKVLSQDLSNDQLTSNIKWTRDLKKYLGNHIKLEYVSDLILDSAYRPFVRQKLYYEKHVNEMQYQIPNLFPGAEKRNLVICFTDPGSEKPFMALASDKIPDLHFCGTQCLSLYRYDENGNRIDNITDWGLTQFQTHYSDPTITKQNIFHYTYAVLHHPAYRTKYELNLKREFPRLPFYADFHQWAIWGKTLMDLHLKYETTEPYGLRRVDVGCTKANSDSPLQETLIPTYEPDTTKPIKRTTPKAKLKADKTEGKIILDTETTLEGVPTVAWDYKLGNRSALEWILDQYKEKTPKDPTIAKLFNTYRFADYKEQVIDLLQRVCTVSVKTMEIIQQMPTE